MRYISALYRGIEMTTRRYFMLLSGYLLVLAVYCVFIELCIYPRGDSQFLTDESIIRSLDLGLDPTNETQIVVAVRITTVG